MNPTVDWSGPLARDVAFGHLNRQIRAPRQQNPRIVLNNDRGSMLHALRSQLKHSLSFTFSVAFVTPRAVALLKQEFVDHEGPGTIITSNYLGFNSPQVFAELLNLQRLGIDVRLHSADGFHPKGYVFGYPRAITAIIGSANLTESALVSNHEWNVQLTAAIDSDLAQQVQQLLEAQTVSSSPLHADWVDEYRQAYRAPSGGPVRVFPPELPGQPAEGTPGLLDAEGASGEAALAAEPVAAGFALDPLSPIVRDASEPLLPNEMQKEALVEIDALRRSGKQRALVISATGTGKTILSALDVQAVNPERMLFVVHREQILDRAIEEFQRVLGLPPRAFGKLTGRVKQDDRRFVFATVQTLSQPNVLATFEPDEFDYILIDEVHRVGAPTYQRIVDHFRPKFLLGMTATPERTDGFNVFELFDFNVPYEIRLSKALESDMLAPFHYYGIADFTFEDDVTITDTTELRRLVDTERVTHIVNALETYGQAGVTPKGLIFCSRKEEAHGLSSELNRRSLRGRQLQTVALTGDDSIQARERAVERLEAGELDYILTVDIFNEGVDIPAVNQIVMLRQTESSIVFVQQLGRGLRKAAGKEYLVVIDFIGNYANNYLIPTALFGDDSLNRESLRKNLIAAEEIGVLAGLSSVRFDRLSQERVLNSIVETKLDSQQNLKYAMEMMRNRVGGVPELHDFLRFESVDPVVLATRRDHYPDLVRWLIGVEHGLTDVESRDLHFLSHEVLVAKRLHELTLLEALLKVGELTREDVVELFERVGIANPADAIDSAVRVLNLDFLTEPEQTKYVVGPADWNSQGRLALRSDFLAAYQRGGAFAVAIDDLVRTGIELIGRRYPVDRPFAPGVQYSRKDACRLLGWDKNMYATVFGYRVDYERGSCPIFVTYHKPDDVAASTAYEDTLLSQTNMLWYTRSRRTLASDEVRAIVDNVVDLHVFAKKDDADGADFYYLGRATAHQPEQTTMVGDAGNELDVVRMHLLFDEPIPLALFNYFEPEVTI